MSENFEKIFWQRYQQLNLEQKQAVDTIDGPLMVVAGPGTGKTELLSMRVANILRQTDTLPESILCLTFTDSAAVNMRERLTKIIGPQANKVCIHTFHSFGTEVINHNPEYFFSGARYMPADDLASIEILQSIFNTFDYDDPLNKYNPKDGWTYLDSIRSRIRDLKKEGITPEVFEQILDDNETFISQARDIIKDFFANKISKSLLSKTRGSLLAPLSQINFNEKQPNYSLKKSIVESLQKTLDKIEAQEKPKTNELTSWRNSFCKVDEDKKYRLKADLNHKKYRSLARIYQKYQEGLHQSGLFDFEDMLLEVLKAFERHKELRYNYQEQFLYILVDEFQDTSGVQTKLIDMLIDTELTNNRPNLMVVGDDDQSIFKFQGASLSNILNFRQKYPTCQIITLTKNYRSKQTILDFASHFINNCEQRLTDLPEINKILISQVES